MLMKKTLAIISAASALALVSSSVVACGVAMDTLMSRRIDPKTLRQIYLFPLTNWSTGVTMNAEDGKVLSDLHGTLVTTNKYNQEVGDLAIQHPDNIKEGSKYIGKPNAEFTEWTYVINPEARFTDIDGNLPNQKNFNGQDRSNGKITGKDFLNAIWFILHPSSASETINIIKTFIAGTADIADKIKAYDFEKDNGAPIEENELYKELQKYVTVGEIVLEDGTIASTITYKLNQVAPYFDTLMTYTVFSPIPDKAIAYESINGVGKPKQGTYYTYGTDWTRGYFSGAYVPVHYDPSVTIQLVKNQNYVNKDQVYIENIDLIYLSQVTDSKERIYFESGDSYNVILKPSDYTGWSKYVGDDPKHVNFEGLNQKVEPDPTTFAMFYNFANLDIANTSGAERQSLMTSTTALQSSLIRDYLSYTVDRSKYISYYSSALDNGSKTSSFLRNVYTARGFVNRPESENHKDYLNYVEDVYGEKVLKGNTEQARIDLADGADPLLKNDQLITMDERHDWEDEYFTQQTRDSFANKDAFISAVQTELRDINKNYGRNEETIINLKMLQNGAGATSYNKNIDNMIDAFNQSAIDDKINLKIVPIKTKDSSDYISTRNKYNYDIIVSGWSPDYADPMTFLGTTIFGGDMQNYTGVSQLYNYSGGSSETFGYKKPEDLKPEDLNLTSQNNGETRATTSVGAILNENYQGEKHTNGISPYLMSLYSLNYNYSFDVQTAATDTADDDRFSGFGEAEFNLIYKYNYFLPLYVPNGSYKMELTYIKPRTVTTVGYGSSKYKHLGVEMTEYLLTQKERNILEQKYQEDLINLAGGN